MLLPRIIKTLSPEELTKLRKELHLRERSNLLFEAIASDPDSVTSDKLCKRFKVTKNNLYRLCSEIADECVRILAPIHQFPKPEFYRSRFIFEPFVTEIARTERRLIQEDRDLLESFYEYAFGSLLGFPINTMDFKLIESYMHKYHIVKKDPPPDHELQLRMRLLFSQIAALPRQKKLTVKAMQRLSKEMIEPYVQAAESTSNPWVKYYYYTALWKAETYSNIRQLRRIKLIESCLDVVVRHPDQFSTDVKEATERLLAFEQATMGLKIEEAFELYSRLDTGQVPDTSRNGLYLIRYFRICMLAKRFDGARTIVERMVPYPLIQTQSLLFRAILNVAEHRFDDAQADIQAARSQNTDDNFFLPHEMEIRALETIMAFKRGHLELADTLVSRNLKWMQKRRYGLSQSPWPYYYQTIRAAIIFRMTGDLPKPLLYEHYKEFHAFAHLHSILIEEVAAELFRQAIEKEVLSIDTLSAEQNVPSKDQLQNNIIYTKKRKLSGRVVSLMN